MESGLPAAPDGITSLLAAKDAENMTLRNENAVLLTRLTELEGLVAALQAQLGRDSSNSGRPPSSDSPFTKKPAPKRSTRTRSGKPQGKQPGAPSTTLRLVDNPDDTITYAPPVCAGCGNDLADAEIFGVCRHQVFDVPPLPPRPYITEHRAVAKTCGGYGTTTEAQVPGLASGRVQYGSTTPTRRASPGPTRWSPPCCWPTTPRTARVQGRDRLTDTELSAIRSRYAGAIARGWDENAAGRDPLHEQARTLLRRFRRHRDMILRFTVNLDVPFTNNTAELPARSAKVQQRSSSGSWRTLHGLIDFAVVQSYLSTADQGGQGRRQVGAAADR